MAYTQNLGVERLIPGTQQAHEVVNDALDVFDRAIAGIETIDFSTGNSKTLTGGESTAAMLQATGATAACDATVQAVPKVWIIINDTSYTLTVKTAGQATPPTVAAGAVNLLFCDGTIVRLVG